MHTLPSIKGFMPLDDAAFRCGLSPVQLERALKTAPVQTSTLTIGRITVRLVCVADLDRWLVAHMDPQPVDTDEVRS